jgi:hypothetical protein
MESLFLIFLVVLIILLIFVLLAEYNFINLYRKKGHEKQDSDRSTLIFLFLHPEYNFKVFYLALNRTGDKELEKARLIFIMSVILAVLYIFIVELYISKS